MRKKVFCTWPTRAAKAEEKSLVTAQQDQRTKEEPLLFVLFESPSTSVLTVSRGHSFLVSLVALLTVETEANGDLQSTIEGGPSLIGSFGWSCRYKSFLSWLGCSGQPRTKSRLLVKREIAKSRPGSLPRPQARRAFFF
jgi:hypothetical protein